MIARTWNYEFELPDIKDYIKYIIKKHEAVTTIPLIHVYISRINRLFKGKDGYKLELQMPETMKSFSSTKKLTDKAKAENIPSLDVVLVQCNLVDNQYQQKSEVLCTFAPNKSYAYLLNVEPSNLVFLKIYNKV